MTIRACPIYVQTLIRSTSNFLHFPDHSLFLYSSNFIAGGSPRALRHRSAALRVHQEHAARLRLRRTYLQQPLPSRLRELQKRQAAHYRERRPMRRLRTKLHLHFRVQTGLRQ